jgi:hypothetical protein
MIKTLLTSAALVAFLTLPVSAQLHYQGGPRDIHVGPKDGNKKSEPSTSRPAPSRLHYQGGPKSAPHFGDLPASASDASKKN